MTVIRLACYTVLSVLCGSKASAASQLARPYEALARNPVSAESVSVDLARVIPSEEIPIILNALNSGNSVLRNAALNDAIGIIGAHENAASQHIRLNPALPELITEFKVLVPTIASHFADVEPDDVGSKMKDPNSNDAWKTLAVRFTDLIGAKPTSDMVNWMLVAVQSPESLAKGWVAQLESTSIISSAQIQRDHEAVLRGMVDRFRATALDVAPVLSHLSPMPDNVKGVLVSIINNKAEPALGTVIITSLSQNTEAGSEFVDLLTSKALDEATPSEVRAASIYAVARLKPPDKTRFEALRDDPSETIERALRDVGVR